MSFSISVGVTRRLVQTRTLARFAGRHSASARHRKGVRDGNCRWLALGVDAARGSSVSELSDFVHFSAYRAVLNKSSGDPSPVRRSAESIRLGRVERSAAAEPAGIAACHEWRGGRGPALDLGRERPANGEAEAERRAAAARQFIQNGAVRVDVNVNVSGAHATSTATATASGVATASPPRVQTNMPSAR